MAEKQSYPSLTGLKGIFILVIVLYHTLDTTPLVQKIPLWGIVDFYGGWAGNYIFFMISGFLMSLHYRDRILGGGITFDQFLGRRLKKLYPLYLITNLATLAIFLFREGITALDLHEVLTMALLQKGAGLENGMPYNYPTWFVSGLVVCCILFFAAAFHAKTATAYRCVLVGLLLAGFAMIREGWDFPFLYSQTGMALYAFFPGCLLAEILPQLTETGKTRLQLLCLGILGTVMVLILRLGIHGVTSNIVSLFSGLICPELVVLALLFRPLCALLSWKPFRFLGDISMSVFMWHAVLYEVFFTELAGLGILPAVYELRYLVYLAVLIVLSWLSHRILSAGLPRKRAAA